MERREEEVEGKIKGDQRREEESKEGREEEREIKKERVGKTFWGHGFLGTKTKDELKKSNLFYP